VREIKIKVCGMKDSSNIAEVVMLKPHYMGFILYEGSPRYVSIKEADGLVKNIPGSIQKTGVLVNEPLENALGIAQSGVFDLLQLHGNESVDYCKKLSLYIGIIKAFPVSKTLPGNLTDYQPFCAMFLFDTAGQKYGGTGKMFDHSAMNDYSLNTDYILSGGISPCDSTYIKSIHSGKMAGVDLNSRFEIKPGIKDLKLLKNFIENIRTHDDID
jgi:phosphoribosylanthranilate isomerase